MAAARPLVSIQGTNDQVSLPSVLTASIRPDVVQFVHSNMAKNSRQAYAVNIEAGHQHSAESWGTGRAVARIPRVSGGGTHAAGQGAFGNMCRHGRMFAPTKTWRKWHRKINKNQRRYATVSALAASALPALVMARGHRVEQVSEVPLVVSADAEKLTKTKEAIELLRKVGAFEDVEKSRDSRKVRPGKGKMRNRRFVMRRGPLVVYNKDDGICQAFRNLPGVELCQVDRLNLLQLAPGGHMGRFIVWTRPAFERLDEVFGTQTEASATKTGYKLPRAMVSNSDLARVINSDEIQSVVRPAELRTRNFRRKSNPLRNLNAMLKLNPYVSEMRKSEEKAQAQRSAARKDTLHKKRTENRKGKKEFYNNFLTVKPNEQ